MGVPIIASKVNYHNVKTLCVIVSINEIIQETLSLYTVNMKHEDKW